MSDVLLTQNDFAALSLLDLLQARELFHVHLMNKRNVVGTAVGRYLIRRNDPYPTQEKTQIHTLKNSDASARKGPKRLEDTEVRYYSWPCVLVFVDRWAEDDDFGRGQYTREDFVPPAIYLPDGRKVPVCVIEATSQDATTIEPHQMAFPRNLLGGGYPVITNVQGQLHIASVGCMVTDGHKAYALTNRHVAGEAGERIYALVDGKQLPVGTTSNKQLTRLPFQTVYPGWPGSEVFVNMDIGLIEVSDTAEWTAQVYGIGKLGKIVDLSARNFSLKLIGSNVRAYGCASRLMCGQVHALFYRYKSIGGFEYVSDFLIGLRPGLTFDTAHGDSGTLWLLEEVEEADEDESISQESGPEKPVLRPMAVQWGGQVFSASGKSQPFALATCLSTVCNHLNVEIVRDWNTGQREYWGAVGHYAIAAKAIDALPAGGLKKLMEDNLKNITYAPADIDIRNIKGLSKRPFVPLADVPDYVWKMGPRRNQERPNHFADMDQKDPAGLTLLDICKSNPANVAVTVWQAYYKSVGDSGKGLLPFRVWQFFDAMVDFIKSSKTEEFVCAAGIVSHYIGDACQPLHISYLHDGDPNHPDSNGDPLGSGVHTAYEDTMVNTYTEELLQRVNGNAQNIQVFGKIDDGHDAAFQTVRLMQDTFDIIKPIDILRAFAPIASESKNEVADTLWKQFGDDTVKVMSTGANLLAHVWQEAWRVAKGDSTIGNQGGAIEPDDLVKLYEAPDFLTSYTLNQIGQILRGTAMAATAGATQSTASDSKL